jgi:hypothetical protein
LRDTGPAERGSQHCRADSPASSDCGLLFREAYRALLNLKILWSSSAVLGLCLNLGQGGPVMSWLFLAAFAEFAAIWIVYRLRLR